MGKLVVGKNYEVKVTPAGKPCGNGVGSRIQDSRSYGKIIVNVAKFNGNTYQCRVVSNAIGGSIAGNSYNYFEYELMSDPLTFKELKEQQEEIRKEIGEKEEEINSIETQMGWMTEVGVDEYDEDEFKVYQALKSLENPNLSIIEKSKLIAKLVKG